MKRLFGISILTATLAAAAPQASDGLKLVWSDEFDTDGKPDPAKWTYETGFVRNQELQWYQPENAGREKLDRGAITGTVTDASGAAVPSAKITVRNSGTNARHQTDSTVARHFTVPNLPFGVYEVAAEATGFKRAVHTNIDLRAAAVARVDTRLEIGQVAETVAKWTSWSTTAARCWPT